MSISDGENRTNMTFSETRLTLLADSHLPRMDQTSVPQEVEVLVKFGNIMTQPVDKSNITDIEWNDDDYYDELHLTDKLLKQANGNWDDIEDKKHVDRYSGAITPNISHYFDFKTFPDVKGAGGVIPILIGENVAINVTEHRENSTSYR